MIRLPVRCVEIIDQLIYAGVYPSRGEFIRDVLRSALREGFHKKMNPEKRHSLNEPMDTGFVKIMAKKPYCKQLLHVRRAVIGSTNFNARLTILHLRGGKSEAARRLVW